MSWLSIAMRRDIVLRSLRVALLVGTILVTINYGDKLLTSGVTATDCVKMLLTYCVPYCVATYASVSAISGEAVARKR